MRTICTTVLLFAVLFTNNSLAVCQQPQSTASVKDSTKVEKPGEALQVITELYRVKDTKTLITKRYSELPDLASAKNIQKTRSILDKRLAKKAFADQMLTILELAQKSTPKVVLNPRPKLSETDQMAEFEIAEGQVLKLYLMKTGLWGFHM